MIGEAQQRGLLLLKAGVDGNCIRVLCPLTTSEAELDDGLRAWEEALAAVFGVGARILPLRRQSARLRSVRTGEERKLVTVLFADLVGSTAFADDRDPERVRVQLEQFYDAMRAEIELTGGTVEKFAGDAVMAVFGAPAALEDHAERALHAALAMQERMRELFAGALELRVGVNTGDVVVGAARGEARSYG